MSGFDRHSLDGLLWGGIAAILSFAIVVSNGYGIQHGTKVAGLIGAMGFVMTIFPDVDHPESKPRRYLVAAGSLVGIVGLAYVWSVGRVDLANFLANILPSIPSGDSAMSLVLWGLVILAIALPWAIDRSVDTLTISHRNWTHSPVAIFLATLLIVAILWKYSLVNQPKVAMALGLMGGGGIAVHIGRDWAS
jgi:membrane-bound metal-dependent hydrolase YbcI (DUF457 family)